MKNKKNIEQFFQESFKDFKVQAPEDSWEKINQRIDKKKKKRVFPFWLKLSGYAATFLLGLMLFENNSSKSYTITSKDMFEEEIIYEPQSNEKDFQIVNELKINKQENIIRQNYQNSDETNLIINSKTVSQSSTLNDNSFLITSVLGDVKLQKKWPSVDDTKIINASDYYQLDFTEITLTGQNFSFKNITNNIFNSTEDFTKGKSNNWLAGLSKDEALTIKNEQPFEESNEILDYLAKLEDTSEEKKSENNTSPVNRWSLIPNVAPVTMNSFSSSSPISDQLNGNSKEYLSGMSVGLGINYALTKKINIRTGVNKFMVGYNTHDVAIYATANVIDLLENQMNINYTNISSNVVVKPENLIATESSSLAMPQTTGHLNHKFGYIEIPMEVSYKLLDTKFDIDVIGGFSTLFLQENEVSVIGNGLKTTLGEANNMNDVHFSTNLGVGFRYEIFKSFDISLEPMFKYQIGTYSKNSEGFKPYILGIYTGLSFKF